MLLLLLLFADYVYDCSLRRWDAFLMLSEMWNKKKRKIKICQRIIVRIDFYERQAKKKIGLFEIVSNQPILTVPFLYNLFFAVVIESIKDKTLFKLEKECHF